MFQKQANFFKKSYLKKQKKNIEGLPKTTKKKKKKISNKCRKISFKNCYQNKGNKQKLSRNRLKKKRKILRKHV